MWDVVIIAILLWTAKRLVFKKLEAAANHKRYIRENRNLKRQCRDGRTKLSNVLYGDNTKQIRNFLINHKDMQRLYQKMPVELVVDNINQRTFVMRKERDRLKFRLDQMKNVYKDKLVYTDNGIYTFQPFIFILKNF